MRISYQPPKQDARVATMRYNTKTVTDISVECLQLLIRNGYGKAQASDLVKRCKGAPPRKRSAADPGPTCGRAELTPTPLRASRGPPNADGEAVVASVNSDPW